ncbi:MAG: CoA transferase, partial [Alphaproteobacteria bacterium]
LGLEGEKLPAQADREGWPMMREKFEAIFKTRTRDEWSAILEPEDLCYAPVLNLEEAPKHPHNVARKTFVEHDGFVQPAPAPRFSRTPGAIQGPAPEPGEHTDAGLADWGFSAAEIAALRGSGAAA